MRILLVGVHGHSLRNNGADAFTPPISLMRSAMVLLNVPRRILAISKNILRQLDGHRGVLLIGVDVFQEEFAGKLLVGPIAVAIGLPEILRIV